MRTFLLIYIYDTGYRFLPIYTDRSFPILKITVLKNWFKKNNAYKTFIEGKKRF